jgi:hypothetical protein
MILPWAATLKKTSGALRLPGAEVLPVAEVGVVHQPGVGVLQDPSFHAAGQGLIRWGHSETLPRRLRSSPPFELQLLLLAHSRVDRDEVNPVAWAFQLKLDQGVRFSSRLPVSRGLPPGKHRPRSQSCEAAAGSRRSAGLPPSCFLLTGPENLHAKRCVRLAGKVAGRPRRCGADVGRMAPAVRHDGADRDDENPESKEQ